MELIIDRLDWPPVALELLDERHRADLEAATNADPDIWDIYPYSMAGPHFAPWWEASMALRGDGRIRFAVCLDGRCVGTSSYLNIDAANRGTDIGGTYYRPDVRGGIVNPAAKLLMMRHAFERGAERVVFQVDAINARSRAAVRKLGAVEEGVLRRHKQTWTGRWRDTAISSVLRSEWPAVEARLLERLARLQA